MPLEKPSSYSEILESYNSMTPSIDKEEQQKITQKTISDLREDEKFLENSEIALGWLGDNINKSSEIAGFGNLDADSDPIEAIRDSQWNTAGMASLAWNINDAPDDVKEAWAYIRKEYDEADTRGFWENAEALWDVGVDIVSDPVTLGALISVPLTGGTSAAGALTTRAGLTAAARTALGKFGAVASGEMTKSAVKNGVIAGTMYGGLESHSRQNTDLAIGLQDKYSLADLGFTMGAGAGLGAAGAFVLPKVGAKGYNLTKEFFENKNRDKLINKLGDDIDPPSTPTGDPEAEELADQTINIWKQNNAVPRNFRDQVMNEYDLNPEEADDILTSIFEIKSKDKQTPEDTKIINEIKDSFDLDIDDIDNITNDYATWLSSESEKVPQGFIDSFVSKWTPFENARELNNNRNLSEGIVEEKIQFILNTGGRKKITAQEQEVLDDILDEFDLTADDYTEILDDVAVYRIDNPTPQAQANRKLAEETAGKAGLGEKSADELEGLLDGASKDPELRRVVPQKWSEVIHRGAGNVWMGRPASKFKAYVNESPRLKELVNLFRYDTTNKDLFNTSATVKRVGKDYFETLSTLKAGWTSRIQNILDNTAFNYRGAVSAHNQKIIVNAFRGGKTKAADFENQDKSFRLNPFINDRLLNKDTTNIVVTELRGLFDEIGTELLNRGIISNKEKNYFPRLWDAQAIEKNKDKFADLLMDDIGVSKNDADNIIRNMLDTESNSVLSNPTNSHFFYNRKLDIQDESRFTDFLEQDLTYTLINYADISARAIAKQDIFKVKKYESPLKNIKTFKSEWVDKIKEELKSSGISVDEIRRTEINLQNVWNHLTGENIKPVKPGLRTFQDAWTVAGRTALLPAITISSLTEPFINIAKAGPKNAAYGFVDTVGALTTTWGVNFKNKLAREYKYKIPEVWREMEKAGSSMYTAASQMSQRSGDRNIRGTLGRINYHFMRGVIIDQWTKFVQLLSHNTAKRVIKENLTMLHDAGVTRPQSKLKNNTLQTKQAELLELDIDIEQGINWIKNGADTEDAYWKEGILTNIPRYVREVIVPTDKAAATVPMAHNNPAWGFIFDLLSYPAAYSNTVLTEFVSKAARNKSLKVTANSLAAFTIMTAVARFGNYVRSRGESEDYEDDTEIWLDAVKRHGGYGPLEPIVRGRDAWKYSGNIFNAPTALLGPTGGDISKVIQTGGVFETLGQTRTPLVQGLRMVNPALFESYTDFLRELDLKIKEARPPLKSRYTEGYAKGGLVEDVPQVPEEPDERIDKMTGLPYDEQAGEAFIDEEDRLGFALGGKIGGKIGKKVSSFIRTYTDDIAKNSEMPPSIIEDVDTDVPEVSKSIDEPTQLELPEVAADTSDPSFVEYIEDGLLNFGVGEKIPSGFKRVLNEIDGLYDSITNNRPLRKSKAYNLQRVDDGFGDGTIDVTPKQAEELWAFSHDYNLEHGATVIRKRKELENGRVRLWVNTLFGQGKPVTKTDDSNLIAARDKLNLSEKDSFESVFFPSTKSQISLELPRGEIKKNKELHVGYIEDLIKRYIPKTKKQKETLAQAQEQGFNTNQWWYHGTPYNFDEFKYRLEGEAATLGGYFNDFGFFFSNNREYPSSMGSKDFTNVIPVFSKIKKPFITKDHPETRTESLEGIYDWLINNNKDFKNKYSEEYPSNLVLKESLQNMGYDGILTENSAYGDEWLIVFKPTDVRSVKAVFDIKEKDSPKLKAYSGGKILGSLGRTSKSQGGKILSSLNKLKGTA